MAETSSFDDLLVAPVTKFERPPVVPSGTWKLIVEGFEQTESSVKKTPGVQFTFGLVEPGGDVDPAKLDVFRKKVDLGKRKLKDSFWFTDNAMFMLREFFEKAGVAVTNKNFKQCLQDSKGKVIKAYVSETPSKKKGDKSVFNQIESYTAS